MKIVKYFILFFLIFIRCDVINASYDNTYDESVNYVEDYIKDFKNYERFLYFNNNKFGISENGLYEDDDFTYGGFINKIEYDVIGKTNSYLYDGSEYFSMSKSGANIFAVPDSYKNNSEKSGLRVTEFIKPRTKVIGTGSYTNPWQFTTLGVFVRYDENKGMSNVIDNIALEEGDIHYIKDYIPERENYAFSGWKLDRSEGIGTYFSGDSYEAYADTTFYAAWRKIHKVSYDLNGGSGVSTNTFDVIDGEYHIIDSIAPTREGYTFMGWSTSSSTTANYTSGNSYKVSADTTFYAVWKKYYTVKYNANGGSGADSTIYKVNEGDTYTITSVVPTASDSTNYTFAGWATSSTGSVVYKKSQSGVSVTSDLVLYAVYVPYVAQVVGGSKYTSLASAISAISSSGTIKLLKNMSKSENVTIPSGKTITINLNSKTAKGKITNQGSLTISNGTYTNSGNIFVNTGTLTISSGTYTSSGNAAISNTTGNVNVNGGNITGSTYGISNTSGIVRVYGGTVTGSTYGIYGTGSNNIYVGNSGSTLSTSSPKVSGGSYGVYMSSSSLGFYFYNGVISGTASTPYSGSVTKRSSYKISTSKSGSYYNSTLYYSSSSSSSSGGSSGGCSCCCGSGPCSCTSTCSGGSCSTTETCHYGDCS